MSAPAESAGPVSPLEVLGRRAGAGLHITALPGPYGIGDLGDAAHRFIDDLAVLGLRAWQFLPVGPTAFGNSPYQPLSAFAGSPLLIGLEPLVRAGLLHAGELRPLTELPPGRTDYQRVHALKHALLLTAGRRFPRRADSRMRTALDEFRHHAGPRWLDDYALFRALKAAHDERAWPEWAPACARRERAALRRAAGQHGQALDQVALEQFLFDHQWRSLRRHADDRGICLFGDMPIYLALDSADAWARPGGLQLDDSGQPTAVAGVPPDYFSADGQLWGNPLYDWNAHAAEGFAWWIERMRQAIDQSHLVRIDHFRGFESYWAVPHGAATARTGEWESGPGDALFHALRQALAHLPIVAEDLGIITRAVEELRGRHGLPGMKVLQFALDDPHFCPQSIERNSVVYTGTHDNDTTRGWFLGGHDPRTPEQIQHCRARALHFTGGSESTIHLDLARLALSSAALLAIVPVQDLLGLGSEARFNRPGTIGDNWTWRLQPGWLTATVQGTIMGLVEASARG